MTNFESVKKFMQTFRQEVKTKADFPNDKITKLRLDLIREELSELEEAIEKKVGEGGKSEGSTTKEGVGTKKEESKRNGW